MTLPAELAGGVVKGGTVTLDGQRALELRTHDGTVMYVSEAPTPELLRAVHGHVQLDFIGYDAYAAISPPPVSQVFDLSQIFK